MVPEFIQQNKCDCESQGQVLLWKQMDPIFLPTPQHSSLECSALRSTQGQVTAKEETILPHIL